MNRTPYIVNPVSVNTSIKKGLLCITVVKDLIDTFGGNHMTTFLTHKKNHANLCNGEHRDHPYCYTFDRIMLIILEIASLFSHPVW